MYLYATHSFAHSLSRQAIVLTKPGGSAEIHRELKAANDARYLRDRAVELLTSANALAWLLYAEESGNVDAGGGGGDGGGGGSGADAMPVSDPAAAPTATSAGGSATPARFAVDDEGAMDGLHRDDAADAKIYREDVADSLSVCSEDWATLEESDEAEVEAAAAAVAATDAADGMLLEAAASAVVNAASLYSPAAQLPPSPPPPPPPPRPRPPSPPPQIVGDGAPAGSGGAGGVSGGTGEAGLLADSENEPSGQSPAPSTPAGVFILPFLKGSSPAARSGGQDGADGAAGKGAKGEEGPGGGSRSANREKAAPLPPPPPPPSGPDSSRKSNDVSTTVNDDNVGQNGSRLPSSREADDPGVEQRKQQQQQQGDGQAAAVLTSGDNADAASRGHAKHTAIEGGFAAAPASGEKRAIAEREKDDPRVDASTVAATGAPAPVPHGPTLPGQPTASRNAQLSTTEQVAPTRHGVTNSSDASATGVPRQSMTAEAAMEAASATHAGVVAAAAAATGADAGAVGGPDAGEESRAS